MQIDDDYPELQRNHEQSSRDLRRRKDASDSSMPSPIEDFPTSAAIVSHNKMKTINREDCAEDDTTPRVATSADYLDCPSYICLCQPEPKIPRPRNAFILYRQHHQQAIIARHPGLHNPDISKIIGEQWKAEEVDQKKVWQDLALKEKARHQEKYPGYRYQPRRTGKCRKLSNTSDQSATVDRCSKCGGRSIKNSTSPFLDLSGVPTLPPPISDGLTPTTQYLPMTNQINLQSPVRRRGHGPSNLSNIQVPSIRDDPVMYSPLTPNKRRRLDYGPPPSSNGRRQEGPYYLPHARRESLPPLQVRYTPPNSASMPPPRTPRDARSASVADFDPNLHASSPARIEEGVNMWTYLDKIRLLGRITPPCKHVSSASPASDENRGAIIAVEGDDLASIKELSEWLSAYLARQNEYSPQIVEPPHSPKDDGKAVAFVEYLDMIRVWHKKSEKMINRITANGATPSDVMLSDKDPERVATKNDEKSTTPPDSPADGTSTKAVVIVPTFQLHAATAYASRIPIRDAYSPTDHWQWMATMWRGTVGPDLTLYVTTFDAKEGQVGAKPSMDEAVRCLTVHKEREGKFVEADLRRVGFEVTEWMKGMGCTKSA